MTELLSAMSALAARFLVRCAVDLQALHSLLEHTQGENGPALERVARIAHSIHGAAAAFGYHEVSACAASLERRIKQQTISDQACAEFVEELHALVSHLDVSITQALIRANAPRP